MSLLGGIGIQSLGQHNQLATQLQMDGWNKLIRTLAHNRDIEENKAAEERQADRQKKAQKKAEKAAMTRQLVSAAVSVAAGAAAGAALAGPTTTATTTATTQTGGAIVKEGAKQAVTSGVKDGVGQAVGGSVAKGAASKVVSTGLSSTAKSAIAGGVGGGVGSTVGGALAQGGGPASANPSLRGGVGVPGQNPLSNGVAQVTQPNQGTGRAGGLLSRGPQQVAQAPQGGQTQGGGPFNGVGTQPNQGSGVQLASSRQLPPPGNATSALGGGDNNPATLLGLGARLNRDVALGSMAPPGGPPQGAGIAKQLPPSNSLIPPSSEVLPGDAPGRFATQDQLSQNLLRPPATSQPASQPALQPALQPPAATQPALQPSGGPLATTQPVGPQITNPATAQARLSGQQFLSESAQPGVSPTRLDSVDQGKSAIDLVAGPAPGSPVVSPPIVDPTLRVDPPELSPGGGPPIDKTGRRITRPASALEALHKNAEETGKPVIAPSPKEAALSEATAADKGGGFSNLSPASQGAILGGLMGLLGSLPGGQAGAQLISQHPTINPGARLRDQEFADRQSNREFNQNIAGRQIALKESQSPSLIARNDALTDAANSRSSRDLASAAATTNKAPPLTGPQKTEASNNNVDKAVQSVRDQFPFDKATGKPTPQARKAMTRAIRGMINPSNPNASPLQAAHVQDLINNLAKEGWFDDEEKNNLLEAINFIIKRAASGAGTGNINGT